MTAPGQDAGTPPRQLKDAAATRKAILRSAITEFTARGYDGVGLRQIAGGAGVTAALVNRYYGTKEQLFAAVVDTTFSQPTVIGSDIGSLAANLVRHTAPDAGPDDPFLLMLRSAGNPQAVEIMRNIFSRHPIRWLAEMLDGRDVDERAEIALALIVGVQLLRAVLHTPALVDAQPADLETRLQLALETIVQTTPTGIAARPKTGT